MRETRVGPLPVAAIIGAAVAGVALVAAGVVTVSLLTARAAEPPAEGTRLVVARESKAAQAAATATEGSAEQEAARYLSEQPTAYWLTPEADGVDTVAGRIADLAAQAREQQAALGVVVYGLPGRDCGNESAGGLATDDEYSAWTARIGQALRAAAGIQKIVILEPDSLALAPDCGNVDQRAAQLRTAVDRLAGDDIWIYLDGGHSAWRPPQEMARLIGAVGATDRVRGFATNVSNYNATDDEIAYAHELSALLGGAHAVIDTSRNGAGAGSTWCNPSGRRIGERGGTIGDDVVDTNLWIKPPGESDGTCNGGPAAGSWWPRGAVQLVGDAAR